MSIRSWTQIHQELVSETALHMQDVTYFAQKGNVSGLLAGVAKALQRLEYDLDRQQRALDVFQATGTDLDALGRARGITRLGPGNAGVVLAAYNSDPTQTESLVAGSVVKSTSGVRFTIMESSASITDTRLGDPSVMPQLSAVSVEAGAHTNVPAYTITTVETAGAGSTGALKVLNTLPAMGGADQESDNAYRERIVRAAAILNNRTRDKYLAIMQAANPEVLRAWVTAGLTANGVSVRLVRRATGATAFTSAELELLRQALLPCVYPDNPEMSNVAYVDFYVSFTGRFDRAIALETIYSNVVSAIAAYVDLSHWPFGQEVRDDTLLALCAQAQGVLDIDRSTFRIQDGDDNSFAGNVLLSSGQLPRLTEVVISEDGTSRTYGSGVVVTQSYVMRPKPNRGLSVD